MKDDISDYRCKRCGDQWMAPPQDQARWWEHLSSKRKGFLPEMGVIDWLRENTDLEEKDWKNIAAHQVKKFGKCCHCGSNLSESGNTECSQCEAFNYNYS